MGKVRVGKSRFLAAVGPQSITIDHSRGLKKVVVVVKKEVSRNSKIKGNFRGPDKPSETPTNYII